MKIIYQEHKADRHITKIIIFRSETDEESYALNEFNNMKKNPYMSIINCYGHKELRFKTEIEKKCKECGKIL